ncbi:hypothetical protein [Streptomyces akebiae]|uniref:Ig-like domain-containing protein n=1 Tax=Streptomyces akebiae TaxID=2865673 RepID=A0ABX8Y356_9ACTN|nr:hypothetical protein [Streptomyces akebiae]QYX82628.1 hypothetical protein K1J60_44210 [Streptomyces akebiae]
MTTQNDDHRPTPAEAVEPTLALPDSVTLVEGSGDAPTQVPTGTEADEPTRVLPTADASAPTVHLGPASTVHLGPAPTVRLGPASTVHLGPASTLHLGPADGRVPLDEAASADAERAEHAEYSATVLASHWIQRPEPDETLVEETVEQRSRSTMNGSPPPDRIEGTVLRFGPGVTSAVAQRTHRTLPALPPPRAPRRRRLRRHALPALVVLGVLAFLAWQRVGPPLKVGTVTVTARPAALECEGTADIVGVVATNGRPGTFSYRWVRSDGTKSQVLKEVMVQGQRQARVHLRWTFQGKGHRTAQAELRILSAGPHTAGTRFTYDCS